MWLKTIRYNNSDVNGLNVWKCVSWSSPLWYTTTYYTPLVLGNKPFPNLLFYQILLYCLHLTTHVNNLVIHPQKSKLAKSKTDISCNFTWVFDLECHGQTSAKVELLFWFLFMKFRKLRSLYRENEKLDPRKTLIFSLFKPCPILWTCSIGHKLFSNEFIYKLLKIV